MNRPHTKAASGDSSSVTKAVSGDNRNVPTASQSNLTTGSDDKTAAGGEASCEQGFSKTAISTLLTQSATIIPPTSTTDSSKNNNDDSEMKKGETGTPIGENTGNDRVTMDKANRPLVPESGSRTAKTSSANGFERSGAVQEISTNPESKSSPPTATSATALPAKKPETTTLRSVLPQPSSKSDCPSPQIIAAMKELQTPSAAPVVASSSTQGKLSMLPNASATAAAGAVGADYPDEYAKIEEALKKQRKPLTDLFSPYVSASDTSLGDARTRLRIALDQTRQLRAAFTERVYGKYRVCLKPPPQTEDILDALKKDPKGMLQKLQHEIKQTKLEKEFEKKEAQRLNHQPGSTVEQPTLPSKLTVNASSTASSCTGASTLADGSSFDNSDDLMFVTGGLSLVVLPESDASRIDMSMYQERAPIHPETRQRVRSISAAAAAAGEAMLEKARRGQSLRTEREKRRQDQYAGGEIMERDEYFDGNYAHHARPSDIRRPIVVATAKPLPSLLQTAVKKGTPASQSSKKMIVTTAKASEGEKKAKRPSTGKAIKSASGQSPAISTAASIKAIRARVQANMSLNTLLSLDAADEELRTDGKFSAATKAIFERGVGIPPTSNPSKGSQSRIRHPFPDSLGGRRRFVGSSSTGSRAPIISSPTDVLLALPPKPTSKERRRFKKISVLETPVATSPRAKSAIRRVVKQFTIPPATTLEQGDYRPRKKRITEIEFMRGVHLNKQAAITAKTDGNTKKFGGSMRDGRTQDIDHMLVVNVLNAVGLVATSLRDDEIRKFDFPGSFSTPIFDEDRLRSFGLPVDAGPFSQSISKVKAFRKKFTSINRSCTDAFCSEQAEKEGSNSGKALPTTEHERKAGATKGHILTSTTTSIAAVVNLRGGGGDGGKDPSGGDERSNQSSESAAEIGPGGSAIRGPHGDVAHRSATMSNSMNSSIHPDLNTHRVVWDERSQQPLILVHTPMVRSGAVLQGHAGHLQAQLHPAEQYHQTNALQLAHQLHMSRLPHHGHQAAGDLAEYIGGLHQQQAQAQAAYGWSSVRAVSAAASSSPHSLAALAISQHRAAMVPMTVQERQDRTRVLLAREQQSFAAHAAATQRHQAVALLGGTAGASIQAYASPGYPHHAGQLLNSSTAALLAHPGIQNSPIFPSAQHAAAQNSQSTTDNVQQVQQNDSDFVVSAESTNCHDAQKEGKINRGHLQTVVVCEDEQRNERGPTAPVVQKKDIVLPSEARNKRKSVENGNDESNAGKKPRVSDLGDTKNPCVSVSQGSCIFSDTVKPHGVDDNAILHEDLNGSDEKVNHSHGIQSGLQSPTEPSADVHVEDSPPKVASSGLQYFVPSAPAGISSNMATLILSARCHEAIQILGAPEVLAAEGSRLVEYIVSVGTAVPIPKTMVLNLVKDRMNAPAFKSGGICSIPALSRDVIVAVILLWLWRNQEDSFQRAFSKSGRIDVDPECKWFVTAAVEKAVSAVAAEVADLSSRSNTPLASAILAHKSKNSAVQKGGEADPFSATSTRIDLLAAAIVNKALNSGLVIDEETVRASIFCRALFLG